MHWNRFHGIGQKVDSEQVDGDRLLETHVLGALDGQPVPGVVVDHLRDGQEPPLEVAQLEVPVHRVPPDPHVHVAASAPIRF